MTVEELVSSFHLGLVEAFELLDLIFQLHTLLVLHLCLFGYLPLLVHGLLLRVHVRASFIVV